MKILDFKTLSISMRIPTDQEWDLLMDVTHEDDVLSHWKKIYSWVNDKENKYDLPASPRAVRGYYSARGWLSYSAANQLVGVGFRPAVDLEPGALSSDIRDGESVVIGTLYMDGKPVRVPQRPTWDGDIAAYVPGAKLEMRSALDDPLYQVKAFNIGGNILVADRNLLKRISYADLEDQSFGLSCVEAAFIQIPVDDGFTHTNIRQVMDSLPKGKQYIPVTITGNSSFAFGLVAADAFDEKLDTVNEHGTHDSRYPDYEEAIREILDDINKESPTGLYDILGVKTRIMYAKNI